MSSGDAGGNGSEYSSDTDGSTPVKMAEDLAGGSVLAKQVNAEGSYLTGGQIFIACLHVYIYNTYVVHSLCIPKLLWYPSTRNVCLILVRGSEPT